MESKGYPTLELVLYTTTYPLGAGTDLLNFPLMLELSTNVNL